MNIKELPNANLIEALYKRYYQQNTTPDNCLSSHWKKYSSEIDVYIDNDGNIKTLKGSGFGDLQNTGTLTRIGNCFYNIFCFIKLPYKKDLIALIKKASLNVKKLKSYLSYDCFRQICSLCVIRQYLRSDEKEKFNVLIIGDGYGFLASLVKSIYTEARVTLVDLGKVLLFQAVDIQAIYPRCRHILINDIEENNGIYDFLYVPAEDLLKIENVKYKLIINIASIGEMRYPVIEMYFDFIRKNSSDDNLFYCCNREIKTLHGGEVVEFLKYPWLKGDNHLVDEKCSFYRYYFSVTPPFFHKFDGIFLHRLTRLQTGALK